MKLLFLCSSLEPGRDGVGDYTRLLAEECVRLGHVCAVISLNDRHLTGGTEEAMDGSGLRTLRLPAGRPWKERIGRAAEFVKPFAPDWMSLQFVNYAFHPKGLVHGLPRRLRPLVAGRKLHIMFHELWIGDDRTASIKDRLVGALQKHCIRRMTEVLKPVATTTSNPAYRAMLAKIGIGASVLPLFGNIPISPPGSEPKLVEELFVSRPNGLSGRRRDWWVVALFGSLHPEWDPTVVMRIIIAAALSTRKRVCIISLGRVAKNGAALWASLQSRFNKEVLFVALGEQSPETLSRWLQRADFGITSSPWRLLGKSGTVAAMLDHGLPMIVCRLDGERTVPDEEHATNPLLYRCDDSLEARLVLGLPKESPRQSVSLVAGALIQLLTEARDADSRDE